MGARDSKQNVEESLTQIQILNKIQIELCDGGVSNRHALMFGVLNYGWADERERTGQDKERKETYRWGLVKYM